MTCYTNSLYDTNLVCGLLLLIAASATAVHIFKGSRSEFAIILTAYSLGFALSNIFGKFLISSCSSSVYWLWTENYVYYLLFC
jgi:hypothetical protein